MKLACLTCLAGVVWAVWTIPGTFHSSVYSLTPEPPFRELTEEVEPGGRGRPVPFCVLLYQYSPGHSYASVCLFQTVLLVTGAARRVRTCVAHARSMVPNGTYNSHHLKDD